MAIQVGDKLPSVKLQIMGDSGPETVNSDDLFSAKKVVLFALPGAFTPTCSARHLPGDATRANLFSEAGVDTIICLSVNDAWVMDAWGKHHNANDQVLMVGDGSAHFTRAVGLELDLDGAGMGLRSQRYAMIVNDGVVELLNVEAPQKFEVSDAETLLEAL